MDSFYSEEELTNIGFARYGSNVKISRKTSIYGAELMEFGDNVRVDDFTVLSGRIVMGSYIHIATLNAIFGGVKGFFIDDYSTLSSRCGVYATSDDYSGRYMTNPTVPNEFTNVTNEKIVIGKHVIVGTGSTILPGSTIGEGCAFGAMSLIKGDVPPWGIYVGGKLRRINDRDRNVEMLEKKFNESR